MSPTSLFDPTNKIALKINRTLNGAVLLAVFIFFSELVPNKEQGKVIDFVLNANSAGIPEGEVVEGGLYDPNVVVDVNFQVLTANNEVLEEVSASFSASVSQEEQLKALGQMGKMIADMSGSMPEGDGVDELIA